MGIWSQEIPSMLYLRDRRGWTDVMIKFVDEPMYGKSVYDVPGVGSKIGGRLKKLGIQTAYDLYRCYLEMDEDLFRFLIFSCGGNVRWQNQAYYGMMFWKEKHFGVFGPIQEPDTSVWTQKMKKFVFSFMLEAPVNCVPGIGWRIAKNLWRFYDIRTVRDLYFRYKELVESKFKNLIWSCGGNSLHQRDAYNSMFWRDTYCMETADEEFADFIVWLGLA